jgi:hypothetical protein
MTRTEGSHSRWIALSGVARFAFVLLASVVGVLLVTAAACSEGGGSESARTGEGPTEASPAASGARGGSGDVAGNTSPGVPITIKTYRSPT